MLGTHAGSDYSLTQLILKEGLEVSPGMEVGRKVTLRRYKEAGFTYRMDGKWTQTSTHPTNQSEALNRHL